MDVGGTRMHTYRGTLVDVDKQDDSLFARMLSGDWTIETDENDYIFLDRDPRSFMFLLQCLRNSADWSWCPVYHSHASTDIVAMGRDATFFSCARVPTAECTCRIDATKTHYSLLGCYNDGRKCMARIIEAYNSECAKITAGDVNNLCSGYTFLQQATRCAALKEGAAFHFIHYVQISNKRADAANVDKVFSQPPNMLRILVACASHVGARHRLFS